MKKLNIKSLLLVITCFAVLTLTACASTAGTSSVSSDAQAEQATLERYDYVADMNGNNVDLTIAQNLKTVKCELKAMNMELTAYCTIEDNILTLTELADGNEQVYKGLSATPYTLNDDGTATPVA